MTVLTEWRELGSEGGVVLNRQRCDPFASEDSAVVSHVLVAGAVPIPQVHKESGHIVPGRPVEMTSADLAHSDSVSFVAFARQPD